MRRMFRMRNTEDVTNIFVAINFKLNLRQKF